MKREELLYKLTGTETPKFVNERENVIIDKCLEIINGVEAELKNLWDFFHPEGKPEQEKRTIFKTVNGIEMVKTKPFNWIRERENADGTGEYFYHIFVGGLSGGHNCVVNESENLLSIAYSAYSSDDPSLKFNINNLEEAGEIVERFVKGMKMESKMNGTIYTTVK